MGEAIRGLLAAPVAIIFILAGIVFLLIAVVGNISGKIEPGARGRLASALLGAVLLVSGLALHFHERSNAQDDRSRADSAAPPSSSDRPAGPAATAPSAYAAAANAAEPAAPRASSGSAGALTREHEPNDQVSQANAVAFGGSIEGKLASQNDRDMFVFTAAADQSRVILRKRSVQGFLGQLDVYDSDEKRIKTETASATEGISVGFPTLPGSTYLVAVQTFGGSAGGEYELVTRGE
jgi:hypothetical protein